MEDFDVMYKIVLVGDASVGKTNLLAYFTRHGENDRGTAGKAADTFHDTCKPTVGVEFGTKTVMHPDGTRIRAQIWDTAGQERYRAITRSHYRRAAGAILVYDVTNEASFKSATQNWLPELRNAADMDSGLMSSIMLVGNKIDLEDNIVVEPSAHAQACADNGLFSKRASAKTGVNVAAAFKELINDIHNQAKKKDDEVDYGEIVNIGGDTFDNSKEQCMC